MLKIIPKFQNSLADFVADFRTSVFRSQAKVGETFHINRTTISRYENGRIQPTIGYIAALAKFFVEKQEISPELLLNYTNEILKEIALAIHLSYEFDIPPKTWDELLSVADSYLERHQTSDTFTDSLSSITLHIEAFGGELFEVETSLDVKISALATRLLERGGASKKSQEGHPKRIIIELVDVNNPKLTRRLRGDQTIGDAGLLDGALLRIFFESRDWNPELEGIDYTQDKIIILEDRIEELEFKIDRLAEIYTFLGDYLQEKENELEFKFDRLVEIYAFLGHYLQTAEFVKKQKPEKRFAVTEVQLACSIDEFDTKKQEQLISEIAAITQIKSEEITFLGLKSGSVLVTLEMPEDAALELMKLYLNGDSFISDLSIEKVEIRPLLPIQYNVIKQLPSPQKPIIKILFLAANPEGTSKLRLDAEAREIDEALLQKAEFRDKFEIIQLWAVRVIDLQSHFLRFQPDIVHFSGHGSSSNEIILENHAGHHQPISNRALSELFSILKDNIRCVVLNACYSEPQAQAIAEHIDCVVCMSNAVGDNTAISFAKSYYQALGYGRSIDTAFKLGVGQIDLEGLSSQDIPQLLCANGKSTALSFI